MKVGNQETIERGQAMASGKEVEAPMSGEEILCLD